MGRARVSFICSSCSSSSGGTAASGCFLWSALEIQLTHPALGGDSKVCTENQQQARDRAHCQTHTQDREGACSPQEGMAAPLKEGCT